MHDSDAVDGSRRLNPVVIAGLKAGQIVYSGRRTGKTITLLTYLAVSLAGGSNDRPIVLCESADAARLLQWMWKGNFPEFPEPLWLGWRQFIHARGHRGHIYLHEPREHWPMQRICDLAHGCGRLAGGVTSY